MSIEVTLAFLFVAILVVATCCVCTREPHEVMSEPILEDPQPLSEQEVMVPRDIVALIATLDAKNLELRRDNARYVNAHTVLLIELNLAREKIAALENEKFGEHHGSN